MFLIGVIVGLVAGYVVGLAVKQYEWNKFCERHRGKDFIRVARERDLLEAQLNSARRYNRELRGQV